MGVSGQDRPEPPRPRPRCTILGCHEPVAVGHDVCSDPGCFWFYVDGEMVSAKELFRWFGLVPDCDIACNNADGFVRLYGDDPDLVEKVVAWAHRTNENLYIREQHCRECGAIIVEGPADTWTVEPGGESRFECQVHEPAGEFGDCADLCSLHVCHDGACA